MAWRKFLKRHPPPFGRRLPGARGRDRPSLGEDIRQHIFRNRRRLGVRIGKHDTPRHDFPVARGIEPRLLGVKPFNTAGEGRIKEQIELPAHQRIEGEPYNFRPRVARGDGLGANVHAAFAVDHNQFVLGERGGDAAGRGLTGEDFHL